MSYNYNSLLGKMMPSKKVGSQDAIHAVPIRQGKLSSVQLLFAASVFSLFGVVNMNAQTPRIPVAQGGFEAGNTFAANGWTVANEGTGPVKWAVGTAASGTSAVGSITVGSASVTLTTANANIAVGQIVYGDGIPVNTFVSAISGTTLTLSQTATASVTNATLGFGKFAGGISVGTTQLTTAAAIKPNSYSLALAAANPNISVGMLISSAGLLAPNTYVASINGTTLGLSQGTINTTDLAAAQTLTFTATSAAISGNSAYISNDNGLTNSFSGAPGNRTVYFYRDITNIPASENAMTLTFDVKSPASTSFSGAGWQVWVAPIAQPVVGTNTVVTPAQAYSPVWAGAVPGTTQISFNSDPQAATTKATAFIPKSFAGTPFRLIFVWTNGSSAGTLPPAAIDNISLTSRTSEEITSAHSGLWSQPGTWDGGKVPTPADIVVLDGDSESVMIDSRYSGCEDLFLGAPNTLVQFAASTTMDDFTVHNDFTLNASGSRFNNHDNVNGKFLKVGHDITVAANARFDSSIGGSTNFQGRLALNGSQLQTVTVAPTGFVGGSVPGINGFGNRAGVINQLEVTNTSTASPNVKWNANGVRISSQLLLPTGRVEVVSPNKLVVGNFGGVNAMNIPAGYGFTSGTVARWMSDRSTFVVQPGTEYPGMDNNFRPFWYPFVSATGQNRSLYLLPDAMPTTAGEVAVTYTDANAMTNNLSITDGAYTINRRYNGSWAFSTPEGKSDAAAASAIYTSTTNHRVGVYANGAFEAIDGTSRLMNAAAAAPGTHQDGTVQPFAFRKGLTIADLSAAPLFVGVNNASAVNTDAGTAIVSAASGDWNTASTWVGGVVPSSSSCANVVIATGHNVTVTTAASAASVTIRQGATLTNNGGATTMTVGCTNNNAAFYNYGTHTMTAGNLKVNGFVAHKTGSFFNQTGGEIIIDSNNNGDAATSVAFGGTSCKIETANLALTGGKITIVDPLVNIGTPVSAQSMGDYTLNTAGATGTFTINGSIAAATLDRIAIASGTYNIFEVGQVVSGPAEIPAGTTITAITVGGIGNPPSLTLTLSAPATAAVAAGTQFNFSSMKNGGSTVVIEANAANANLAVGTGVSGSGIQPGTTITGIVFNGLGTSFLAKITLSSPVSGLGTSPITSQQALSFSSVNVGSTSVTLAAANPDIVKGSIVSGPGIKPGTFIADINLLKLTLSEPIQAGAPSPLVMSVYPFNTQSSGSFIYASPTNYAAGLNHTLQIGDGVSTQNTSLITTGFNCQFQSLGGLLSLGNFTVNAPDGNNRFVNVSSNGTNGTYYMNVQNTFTVAAGSVFKKTFAISTVYVGGNIVNNGTINFPYNGSPLYLGNRINGVDVPTTLPQTISGTGSWVANQWAISSGPSTGYVLPGFTVNNTSAAGVTLQVPNFKVIGTVTITNGILHTSATYPIYCGVEDVTGTFIGGSFAAANGGPTTYIDGPCVHFNKSDSTIGQYKLFPVGKNGKYLPIQIASTGGVALMAEAFDTNSGTVNSANASGLSAARWKVSRVGTAGNFTGYNVKMGSTPDVVATNVIVHATADQGTYDIVSTPASVTNYELVAFGNTANKPSIFLATPQTGGFLGNFAYASGPGCTGTPAPGATIASATSACGGQSVTLSLTTPTTGAGVTYQWQSSLNNGTTWTDIEGATAATYVATPSADTSYRANVTCSGSTGASTLVTITTTPSAATTTGASICTAGPINLAASGSQILNWYDAQTGGTLVAQGTTYSPTVSETTTYYVASGSVSTGTPVNTAAYTGTATSTALFKGIAFDANNSLRLNAVTVYPKNTVAGRAPITVALFNAAGNIAPGTSPVTFIPTEVTGTVGTTSQVVDLNYVVPVGKGYRLVATYGLTANNALGNSTAAITYPTGGTLSVIGNVSDLTAAPSTSANTTNIFHNLTFQEICESVRVPVVATVVNTPAPTGEATQDACATGTIADFTVTGGTGATFTWYSVPTSGTAIPTSTVVTLNTDYYVSQTLNGCEGARLTVKASGPCLGTEDFRIAELKYYPNPVSEQLTITAKDAITRVELYNLLGQQLKVVNANSDNVQIDLNMFAPSTYLIKVYSENKVQFFKVIKK